MRLIKIAFSPCLCLFGLLPAILFASWPVFVPPSKSFLLQNQYIDTENCPAGSGKIVMKNIPIRDELCKSSYCPDNWVFVPAADANCHDLSAAELKQVSITHFTDGHGGTLFSQVTASYGEFSYTFTSPREHWYCMEQNPSLHSVSCANDA